MLLVEKKEIPEEHSMVGKNCCSGEVADIGHQCSQQFIGPNLGTPITLPVPWLNFLIITLNLLD